MTLLSNVPIPLTDPIARPRNWKLHPNAKEKDPNEGLLNQAWADFFLHDQRVTENTAVQINSVSLSAQNASIGATDFSGGTLTQGLYQIQYCAEITTAAGTSSSLTVTFDWTSRGVSKTVSGAAITGNTTSTVQTEPMHTIRIDGASPVRYSTTYASNAAGVMQYALEIRLLRIGA